jgi:hypothetical protein
VEEEKPSRRQGKYIDHIYGIIFDKGAHLSKFLLGEILSFGGHKDRSIGAN